MKNYLREKQCVNLVLIKIVNKKVIFVVNFVQIETQKCDKKEFTAKHRLLKATNLCKPRKFYTTAGGDGGDI